LKFSARTRKYGPSAMAKAGLASVDPLANKTH
jgi:hypothetical protein